MTDRSAPLLDASLQGRPAQASMYELQAAGASLMLPL